MDVKRLCTFVLYGGSFILFLIGFSIPYWLNVPYSGHAGLWQLCTKSGFLGTICFSVHPGNMQGYWVATQVMEILGLIAAGGGLFMCGVGTFLKPENNNIRMLAALAGIASAGCIMIGAIIFGAKKNDSVFRNYDLHAGFGLAIISSIGLGISGILCFLIKSENNQRGGAGFNGAAFQGSGTPGAVINPGAGQTYFNAT